MAKAIKARAEDIYRVVGLNIRARRRQLGMTLENLSEASGLSPSYIGLVERDVKKASLLTLELLAAALGTPVAKLFKRAGPLAALAGGEKIDALLQTNTAAERKVIVATLRRLARSLKTLR
jgi:transcriptional regulator with XRE-family HTH domain